MLQRVPPDMRILTPGFRFFSRRRVRLPCSAAAMAAMRPAAPAPMTTISQASSDISGSPKIDVTARYPGQPNLLNEQEFFHVDEHVTQVAPGPKSLCRRILWGHIGQESQGL